jgi:hypothetical protein
MVGEREIMVEVLEMIVAKQFRPMGQGRSTKKLKIFDQVLSEKERF